MEVKVLCSCGQKFKFDVEPINGVMPFSVNCPVCGADGTAAANAVIAQSPVPVAPVPVAAQGRLQINRAETPPAPPAVPQPTPAARAPAAIARSSSAPKSAGEF